MRLLVFRDDNLDNSFSVGESLQQEIDINAVQMELAASFGVNYIRFSGDWRGNGIWVAMKFVPLTKTLIMDAGQLSFAAVVFVYPVTLMPMVMMTMAA